MVTHEDKIEVSIPLHVTLVNNGPRNEDPIPVIESEELKLSRGVFAWRRRVWKGV